MGDMCPKLPGEIPSKDLSRLYDAREGTSVIYLDYEPFGRLVAHILQELNFDLESEAIDKIVEKYYDEIQKIYNILYMDRLSQPRTGQELLKEGEKDLNNQKAEKRSQNSTIEEKVLVPVMPEFGQMRPIQQFSFAMEQPNFYYWLMFQPSTFFLP